ncbi:MAG: leucine-rich repeat domain-containing protein [Paludibacteraceae bacterium]|nr:leucine-rich repeat domain-containing protein [Paludibacteraceae bacterium]
MTKKLLASVMAFALCQFMLATDMIVKQKNGEIKKFNVEEVEEVIFEGSTIPVEDSTIVDESETPLKFKILSDSTVEVINDDSYRDALIDTIPIPSKVRIDGKVYSVTAIGEGAFRSCSGLTSIKIPSSVTTIEYAAFSWCSGLTSIEIPNSVTTIGQYAFAGCSGLTSIKIPESVTAIKDSTFSDCSGLTSIEIPNSVTSIGDKTFYGCSSLASINIPENVTSIGWYTFKGCSGLASVNIPEGVTYIGYSAFSGCSSLTSISIPESVKSIVAGAFDGCSSLEPRLLVYDNGTKCYGWIGSEEECTSVVIPDGVKEIGDYAFYKIFYGLTSVTFPESLESIGEMAFAGCDKLTTAELSSNLKTLGYGAFMYCKKLDLIINASEADVNVGENAISDCKSVTWLK